MGLGPGPGLGLCPRSSVHSRREGHVVWGGLGVQQGSLSVCLGSEAYQIARQKEKLEEKRSFV